MHLVMYLTETQFLHANIVNVFAKVPLNPCRSVLERRLLKCVGTVDRHVNDELFVAAAVQL